MWKKELEIDVVDDLNGEETVEIESEETDTSDDKSKKTVEDNTPSNKSKKSNWKKMSKSLKAKDKEIADLKAKLAGDDEDEDYSEDDTDEDVEIDENKLTRFFMKNKDAIEHEEGILSALQQFPNMSFEQALTFTKANNSESTSSKSFTTKSVKQTKKLSDLSEEEALKHYKWNAAWFLSWQRKTGRTKF